MKTILTKSNFLRIACLASAILGWQACTSAPAERIPPARVMHFPFMLKKSGRYLMAFSSSRDEAYSYGRLVSLDTASIKSLIAKGDETKPIPWDKVVTANLLVPPDVGLAAIGHGSLAAVFRHNNSLVSIPLRDGDLACSGPEMKAELCAGSRAITLLENDPYAIVAKREGGHDIFIISYLSSDRIDILSMDPASKNDLSIKKSFHAMRWLSGLDQKVIKDRRAITRALTASKDGLTYFLLELHHQNSNLTNRPKGAFLLSLKTSDLLEEKGEPAISTWNLTDLLGVSGVQDFYIKQSDGTAVILSRVPEAIHKMDLKTSAIIETAPMCTGATSMAISEAADMIAIPCFKDGRMATFQLSSLRLMASSHKIGRGLGYAVIDDDSDLIYASAAIDGIVLVLDKKTLEIKGHIFDKAPINRMGS